MNNDTKRKCSAPVVYDTWGHTHQCEKGAVVERDGKWYCKIHDPEYIKEKAAKSKAKWDAKWATKKRGWDLQRLAEALWGDMSIADIEATLPKYKTAPDLYGILRKWQDGKFNSQIEFANAVRKALAEAEGK